MPSERILVVEDEESILEIVSQAMKRHGFEVSKCNNGDTALEMAENLHPDVIILDIMLPKMDGWEVCRRLKSESDTRDIPIIMLTARREEKDVVEGLALGADDYMKKPFSLAELIARVKALLRRTKGRDPGKVLTNGQIEIDLEAETVYLRENIIDLSPTEYQLLEVLAKRPGRVVSREELLAKIWGLYGGDTRTVDVHISRLRHKLDDGDHPKAVIQALRGRGYRLSWEELNK
jgi:two-component system phosphate regulon response regulator PhoB/two-component system alkaline phosphatase synthesis response regulator PhoP